MNEVWTLEAAMEHLTEKIDNLTEKVEKNESNSAKALLLQSVETNRRLDALNGEAGRITRILEASIPREVHERDMKEIGGKIEEHRILINNCVTKEYLEATLKTPGEEIKGLRTSKDINTGKMMAIAGIVSFIMTALAIAAVVLFDN